MINPYMTSFESLGLKSQLLNALKMMNFTEPTEVQQKTIPTILEGKDVTVRSKTGSGKTGAFLIPLMNKVAKEENQAVMVITPTRELALQVADVAKHLSEGSAVRIATIYGGASINVQIDILSRGSNIIIGTPGRIIDMMERRAIVPSDVKYLVLDEADTMLDMGFIEDIEFIISKLTNRSQTLLFSATMPTAVVKISEKYMKNPSHIVVGKEEEITVTTISHMYTVADYKDRMAALAAYIDVYKPDKAIIFVESKMDANRVYFALKDGGYNVALLHGGLSQSKREHSLSKFRQNIQFLIATNVAARGLDIADITDIINFGVPKDPNIYIHRVGRSARMGKNGRAVTIISGGQRYMLFDIEAIANIKFEKISLDIESYRGRFPEHERPRMPMYGTRRFGHPGFGRGGARDSYGGGRRQSFGHSRHGRPGHNNRGQGPRN